MRSSTGRFWEAESVGESDNRRRAYVEFFREMALSGWPSRRRRLPSKSRELSSRIRPSWRLEWIRDAQLTFDRVGNSGGGLTARRISPYRYRRPRTQVPGTSPPLSQAQSPPLSSLPRQKQLVVVAWCRIEFAVTQGERFENRNEAIGRRRKKPEGKKFEEGDWER